MYGKDKNKAPIGQLKTRHRCLVWPYLSDKHFSGFAQLSIGNEKYSYVELYGLVNLEMYITVRRTSECCEHRNTEKKLTLKP